MRLGPIKLSTGNIIPWLGLGFAELKNLIRERSGGLDPRELRVLEYVRANVARDQPEQVLAAMDHFARNDAFLMNVGDEKGLILDRAVRDSGAGRALELGAFCGYSAVRIARLLDGPGSSLTSIELSPTRAGVVRDMVAHAGLSDRVNVINAATDEAIPTLEAPFDLVFLDHVKHLYHTDLLSLEKHELLNPGCIVVADNVGMFAGVEGYLDHVRTSGLYASVHHNTSIEYREGISDMVEVSTWIGQQTEQSS